ncbi:hypothetical protein O6H91_02G121300 [Diphasiastrum complanatum]|uniref:Uncharacterized protein n=1 Tax=Diphasiastrum complanatum TaxID=34168 RepID=A0ACC2EK39_DIPCM|nr:hypothetical protein O6H91_Y552400 [Diphasiastrum complanatum]KAJ7147023.1 hypothetical protein O6H91_Y552400 [Diphasiastrum complanatum]KAJ7147024.1 hypothetical protein O6H91_Y552400 [Diphasiastrum complanatum]KAJ7566851.1 hypothetical protein O6H91_02G121300 [Diphasiastrum complanatum]
MASLSRIIKGDRHPLWLVDAIILSALVYSNNPQAELEVMSREYGLPPSAQYDFVSEEELNLAGFENCRQNLLVVRSLTRGHLIVACRGTSDVSDALVDLNFLQRALSLAPGAAHAGFLDRAKSIPLQYFRRLLVRGENVVLAGHSLGGAVASLLALRLLESTGKWCHAQIQCYTFGCPFFADYRLARHINSCYKRHFVHIVSRNDIIPKVMPLAYTVYKIWAGLNVGPLEDVIHVSHVAFLVIQLALRVKPDRIRLLTVLTQATAWLPGLLRGFLLRAFALVLSQYSGYGYAFAGEMVLVDPETSALELVESHINFQFSFDVMKGHSLLTYIEHVFAVQSAEIIASEATFGNPMSTKVELCTATLILPVQQGNKCENLDSITHSDGRPKTTGRVMRSKVACLIFARRLQEAIPSNFDKKRNKGQFLRTILVNVSRLARLAHRFDNLLLVSSVFCVGIQLRRFILK